MLVIVMGHESMMPNYRCSLDESEVALIMMIRN